MGSAQGTRVDAGPIERRGDGQLSVAFQSSDQAITNLGLRAFDIHGGYTVTRTDTAAFIIRVERAGADSVTLTIQSTQPTREVLRQTVSGTDLQNAVLRACDVAVETTLRSKGFFAGKLAFVGKQRGVSEIYIGDLLFNRVRPLTADRSLVTGPSWSPDGQRLLYTTYHRTGFPDIYMIDLRTNQRTPIATFKGTNTGGAFSPDGRQIAMALSGTGNSEIYVADASGRNVRRLTTNNSLEASPDWSPDGRRIVFESDAPGSPQLYEISASGGPMRRIPTNISNFCSEPAWNPVDANRIAFTVATGGGFQIAVYDFSKRKSEILTSVADSAVEPAWLNDGRHLVFTRRQAGRTRLMVLDTQTKQVRPLHRPEFGDASAASFVY